MLDMKTDSFDSRSGGTIAFVFDGLKAGNTSLYIPEDGERATRDGEVMYWCGANLVNAEPGNRERHKAVVRIVN